jgi:serine/threonine protein kinase
VKPENVVVAHDGRVGMTDFGLAALEGGDRNRAADSGASGGVLIGTLAYMSPEQLWSQPAGPASDQFSFAVMAYEALFGVHPFAGRTVDERRRSVQGGPQRMRGSALSPVLCRGLRMDPAARYPSLNGLLDELDQLRDVKSRLSSRRGCGGH